MLSVMVSGVDDDLEFGRRDPKIRCSARQTLGPVRLSSYGDTVVSPEFATQSGKHKDVSRLGGDDESRRRVSIWGRRVYYHST